MKKDSVLECRWFLDLKEVDTEHHIRLLQNGTSIIFRSRGKDFLLPSAWFTLADLTSLITAMMTEENIKVYSNEKACIDYKRTMPSVRICYPGKLTALCNRSEFLDQLSRILSTELQEEYWGVADTVNRLTKHSPRNAWILLLSYAPVQNSHYCRFQGNLNDHQIYALRQFSNVPSWLEETSLTDGSRVYFYCHPRETTLLTVQGVEAPVSIDDLPIPSVSSLLAYFNGNPLKDTYLDTLKSGEVLVYIKEEKIDKNLSINFSSLPFVQLYLEDEKVGPFMHPDFIGKRVVDISLNNNARSLLQMGVKDSIAVFRKHRELAHTEKIDGGCKIYVKKHQKNKGFLMSFSSVGLLDKRIDKLVSETRKILFNSETKNSKVKEIVCNYINVTDSPGKKIAPGDKIKITISRSP